MFRNLKIPSSTYMNFNNTNLKNKAKMFIYFNLQ